MIETFLIGVIVAEFLIAGLFFFKFWRHTGDFLFVAFALAFCIEAFNRTRLLALDDPSEGSPSIYLVRLCAYLLILVAIARKNFGRG